MVRVVLVQMLVGLLGQIQFLVLLPALAAVNLVLVMRRVLLVGLAVVGQTQVVVALGLEDKVTLVELVMLQEITLLAAVAELALLVVLVLREVQAGLEEQEAVLV